MLDLGDFDCLVQVLQLKAGIVRRASSRDNGQIGSTCAAGGLWLLTVKNDGGKIERHHIVIRFGRLVGIHGTSLVEHGAFLSVRHDNLLVHV